MHQSLREVTLAAFSFEILDGEFTFYRFEEAAFPQEVLNAGGFVIDAAGDRSLIAPSGVEIEGYVESTEGWRCLKIREDLSFSEVGVAASITADLASEGISVLVMSGYSHDYFFMQGDRLEDAVTALTRSGHSFQVGR